MAAQEAGVGITEYISNLPGFSGILKHRVCDFQVSEISKEGKIAELTTLQPPKGALQNARAPLPLDQLPEGLPAAVEAFQGVAGGQCANRLKALLEAIIVESKCGSAGQDAQDGSSATTDLDVEKDKDGSLSVTLPPITDKTTRTAVHNFFKGNELVPAFTTSTIIDGAGGSNAAATETLEHLDPAVAAAAGLIAGSEQQTESSPSNRGKGRLGGRFGGRGNRGSPAPDRSKEMAAGPSAPSLGRIKVTWHPNGGKGLETDQGSGRGGRGSRGRGGRGGRGNQRVENDWGGSSDEKYVRFVLYKENMDTQHALGTLARALHFSPRFNPWGFAGTKDKRGATSQWVTAFKVHPNKLAAVNDTPWLRGVRIGNFEYTKEPLQLGDLLGNRFLILMRGCMPVPGTNTSIEDLQQQLSQSCQAIKEKGFINYFGMQRFGTAGTPTHLVGAALLCGEFCKAVDLIMSSGQEDTAGEQDNETDKQGRETDKQGCQDAPAPGKDAGGWNEGRQAVKPEVVAGRKAWFEDRDPKEALKHLPRWMVSERAIMSALAAHMPKNNEQQQPSQPKTSAQTQPATTTTTHVTNVNADGSVSKETSQQPTSESDIQQPAAKKAKVEQGDGNETSNHNQTAMETDQPVNDSKSLNGTDGTSVAEQIQGSTAGQSLENHKPEPADVSKQASKPGWKLAERMAAEAVSHVPRTLRMMYLHAWQSYIWNTAASYRIKEHEHRVIAGDLVFEAASTSAGKAGDSLQDLARLSEASAKDDAGATDSNETGTEAEGSHAKKANSQSTSKQKVHVVTAEEAEAGVYSLEDVVLPLPGTTVKYPQNNVREIYQTLCEKDGVSISGSKDDTNGSGSKRKQPETPGWAKPFEFNSTLPGDYRRLTLRPRNFNFKLLRYSDVNDSTLLPSPLQTLDKAATLETLQKQDGEPSTCSDKPKQEEVGQNPDKDVDISAATPAATEALETKPTVDQQVPGSVDDKEQQGDSKCMDSEITKGKDGADVIGGPGGSLLALQLDFCLPSSAYATMLIRELTRQDTSRGFQASLTAHALAQANA